MKNVKEFLASIVFVSSALATTIILNHPKSFLTILAIATVGLGAYSHVRGWFMLDDRQLFKQPLFILSIAYPIFLFVSFGAWAWKGNEIDLSSNGYLKFIEISKLPLIILASSVPLAAIVNNVHRTIQTEKQIDEAGLKNRNDIYYGHLKFILDQLEKIKSEEITEDFTVQEKGNTLNGLPIVLREINYNINSSISIQRPMDLYRKIFTETSSTNTSNLSVSLDFLSTLKMEWEQINTLCLAIIKKPDFKDQNHAKYQENLMRLYSGLNIVHDRLCNFLCLKGFHSDYSFHLQDKAGIWHWTSTFCSGKHIYKSLKSLASVTTLILDKVRDPLVEEKFQAGQPILAIGSGFIENISLHFEATFTSSYENPAMSRFRPE